MISKAANRRSRILIAGAGPAGSSLAIRLASQGHEVSLVEREKFPRQKLCGEFISPECLGHFRALGVEDVMLRAGGERIVETRFYDRRGRSFTVPSDLLDGNSALGLSRAEMDLRLLEKARALGVRIIDGSPISRVSVVGTRIQSVEINSRNEALQGDLFIDATGRSRVLTRMAERVIATSDRNIRHQKPAAVGYKAHFQLAERTAGVCEIYSFPGGYGGLSPIENGLSNLCFMVTPKAARDLGPSGDALLRNSVGQNKRAAGALQGAARVGDWITVSVPRYGKSDETGIQNLIAVGDASAFIDPFTGSGMLMAMESSDMLASSIHRHCHDLDTALTEYRGLHKAAFANRLRICSILRKAAFAPVIPTVAVLFLKLSRRSLAYVAAATRDAGGKKWSKQE